jgi:hypothetical protein
MEKPFINPRTLAVHFPGDKEQPDGTSNVVGDLARDFDSIQPLSAFDFNQATEFRKLELLVAELHRLLDLVQARESELGNPDRSRALPTVGQTTLNGFNIAGRKLEEAMTEIQEALSLCYFAAQQDADEREYDRVSD